MRMTTTQAPKINGVLQPGVVNAVSPKTIAKNVKVIMVYVK
jgi:hypothetical protein